jgi:hypothetical protein
MRLGQRRVLRRRDDNLVTRREKARHVAGQQAVGGDCAPADDRRHADDHVQPDRHSGENEMIMPAHQEHRQVREHARSHGNYANGKGP